MAEQNKQQTAQPAQQTQPAQPAPATATQSAPTAQQTQASQPAQAPAQTATAQTADEVLPGEQTEELKPGKKYFIVALVCTALGGLFFVLFGIEAGYSWFLAGLCAAGGLSFTVSFFAIWTVVEKHSKPKPVTFEDPRAQKRLQEDEQNFSAYEARYHGRIPVGKGLKSAVCEAYLYLLPDKLRISYVYFRKIRVLEFGYGELAAEIDGDGFFHFGTQSKYVFGRLMDGDGEIMRLQLQEKGVAVESDEPFPDFPE